MSNQDERLQALLDDLENHRVTVAQACAQVRGMTWPKNAGKTHWQTRLHDAMGELEEPPPAGSFADVAHEYHAGRIDYRTYEQLHQAYTEAHGTGGA